MGTAAADRLFSLCVCVYVASHVIELCYPLGQLFPGTWLRMIFLTFHLGRLVPHALRLAPLDPSNKDKKDVAHDLRVDFPLRFSQPHCPSPPSPNAMKEEASSPPMQPELEALEGCAQATEEEQQQQDKAPQQLLPCPGSAALPRTVRFATAEDPIPVSA